MNSVINNRYRILRKLGRSQLGTVYLVEDYLQGGRHIALKKIEAGILSPDILVSFRREFELTSRLKHPNLVRVYDFEAGLDDGSYFITMEFAGNKTLDDIVNQRGALPFEETLSILVTLARTLSFIHNRSIIHRDVKPGNLMVHNGRLRLMDFGLATLSDCKERQTRATFHYMAPEILHGLCDERADLFSAGVTFYRLLTGNHFYRCDSSRDIIDFIKNYTMFEQNRLNSLQDLTDQAVRELLAGLTAYHVKDRISSAVEIIDVVNRLFGQSFPLETTETQRAYVLGTGFIGRNDEPSRLRILLKKPGTIVIRGQSGTGKSTLIQDFRKHCQLLHRINWYEGYCRETHTRAYQPFLEILFTILLHMPEEQWRPRAPLLKRLLPYHRLLKTISTSAVIEPHIEGNALIETISDILITFSMMSEHPVIYVINDLQWADELSIATLQRLLEKTHDSDAPCNLRLLLSWQENNHGGQCGYQKMMEDIVLLDDIVLTAFSEEQGRFFLEAVFNKASISPRLSAILPEILRWSDGNPLLLREYVKILLYEGFIRREGKQWECQLILPDLKSETRNDLFRHQLSALGLTNNELEALHILVLFDDGVTIDEFQSLLADRIDISTRDFLQKLELHEILQIDIIEGRLRYYFNNLFLQRLIADDIVEPAKLHLFIAEQLERIYAHRSSDFVDSLAYHYGRAGVVKKAMVYLEKAADRAKAVYANSQALDYYNQLLPLFHGENPRQQIETMLKKGEILELIGSWQECHETYAACIEIAEKAGLALLFARAKHALGRLYRSRGDYQKAFQLHRDAFHIYRDRGEDEQLGRVIGDMGNIYWSMGEFDQAMNCYQRWLERATVANDRIGVSQALNNIGNIYLRRFDYDTALTYYQQKLDIDRYAKNRRGQSSTLLNMGMIFKQRCEFSRAMELFHQALDIATECGDLRMQGVAIANVGNVHFSQRAYPKSLECYVQYLKITAELGDKRGISNALGSIGTTSLIMGNFDKAERCLIRTQQLAKKQGNRTNLAITFGQLAKIAAKRGDSPKALQLIDRSIELCREIQFENFLAEMLQEKADFFFKHGQLAEARIYNLEAREIAETIKHNEIIFDILLLADKIRFQETENAATRAEIINELRGILTHTTDDLQIATLHDVLFHMSGNENDAHRAITLYRRILAVSPIEEVSTQLEQLEKLLANPGPNK